MCIRDRLRPVRAGPSHEQGERRCVCLPRRRALCSLVVHLLVSSNGRPGSSVARTRAVTSPRMTCRARAGSGPGRRRGPAVSGVPEIGRYGSVGRRLKGGAQVVFGEGGGSVAPPNAGGRRAACTIVARNYVGLARVLEDSFRTCLLYTSPSP